MQNKKEKPYKKYDLLYKGHKGIPQATMVISSLTEEEMKYLLSYDVEIKNSEDYRGKIND